ncbi:MAG TPA: MFS transporter, partial [Ktedonobacterales bacterium]|nr:MFS transporter [Ktedonobacterales bacterium]
MATIPNENTPVAPSPDEPLGNIADVSAAPLVAPTNERRGSAWRVMRNRDYSLLFWGQLISAAGTQIQVVAVAWQVYQITNSAIALGVIGLVQAIPRLIFSLIGGVVADAYDRQRLLIVVNIVLGALSAVLAVTTALHVVNVGVIYVVVLLAAVA